MHANHRRPLRTLLMFALAFQLTACAQDSYRSQGAASGAKRGAASGAVAGAVGAMIWGGDPIAGAASGAAMGSAAGATSGAMAGGAVDRRIAHDQEEQRKAEEAKVREEVGPAAFAALEALAECDHDAALQHAKQAQKSSNPNYAISGLWAEALVYADSNQDAQAHAMFPTIVERDWEAADEAAAKKLLRRLQVELEDIREEYELPRNCG